MNFELIDKLKAVRDAYERHPTRRHRGINHAQDEVEIKELNNMIKQELYKLKQLYKASGNRAMVEKCNEELKNLMGPRLFEAESLVPSGILDAVPSTASSMQQYAFRGGPQPATFVHGFYDRSALNPSVQAFVPAVPVRNLNPNASGFMSHAHRTCFKCGSTGHVQRNCPKKGGKSRKHNKGRKGHNGRKTRRN